jgi:hypothetical protein
MKILAVLTIAVLVFSGCKKDDFIEIKNEVIIELSDDYIGSMMEPSTYPAHLPYFDISNYSNVKSVIMAVNDLKTFGSDATDVIGEGSYELVDLTNNQVIENSIVSSDDIAAGTYKASANFINNLPKGKFKPGIKIYSNGDYTTVCQGVYLILSR